MKIYSGIALKIPHWQKQQGKKKNNMHPTKIMATELIGLAITYQLRYLLFEDTDTLQKYLGNSINKDQLKKGLTWAHRIKLIQHPASLKGTALYYSYWEISGFGKAYLEYRGRLPLALATRKEEP